MAPTFRSSRSGRQFGESANRSRTSAADHDIFEGLPIRRWTRQAHTISQDAKPEGLSDQNASSGSSNNVVSGKADQQFPELPMPKDSHLLAPHSRALLRAARAGYIYLLPASKDTQPVDERDVPDTEDTTTSAVKNERSYTARKWSQIPRHVELPEVEFLAKRRPGLPSLYGASGAVTAAVPNASQPMRKAKIRKVDPDTGNITIYDAWIPEGQKVEGEIKDESQASNGQPDATVIKATPAPGTVVEGVGVANAEGIVVASAAAAVESPTKRKGPPPPKRKGKGLRGRGRKKVMFAPGEGAETGGEERGAEGEQDEDEDDEEGEEGEDAEDGEETNDKSGETPQTDTPVKEPAPVASNVGPDVGSDVLPDVAPDAATSTATNEIADTVPKLDPETTPSLPPPATDNENIPARTELLIPEPQSPIRPQSEQLTPPGEPTPEIEPMKVEEVPKVKPEPTPSADMMEDIQQTQPVPEVPVPEVSVSEIPVTEKIEVTETVQPVVDDTVVVEAETKVERTLPETDAPTTSAVVEEPQPAMTVPEVQQPDVPDTVEASPIKEPSQPAEETSQVKTELPPATEPHPEPEAKPETQPAVSEPVAEEQAIIEPNPPAEETVLGSAPAEVPVDEQARES